MFERRAKIFVMVLIAIASVLLIRAAQVQLVQRQYWREQGVRAMTRPELIETSRGSLLDRKGRPIAVDVPSIDACVDYRAIPHEPDEKWVRDIADTRLKNRLGNDYRRAEKSQHDQLLQVEIGHVKSDIHAMWDELGRRGKMSSDQIDEIRLSIERKVEMRKRYVWYHKYQNATKGQENREPAPWYKRWLIDETQQMPEIDEFDIEVAEQTQPQVILQNIDNDTNNDLGKHIDDFPGLVLRASVYRNYPYKDIGAHVIGYLAKVTQDDLDNDPNFGVELRKYIRSTIDIELQQEVQVAFSHVVIKHKDKPDDPPLAMPGAAVVIKIDTGEVLALASYPNYDLNLLDENYASLAKDAINRPLMNRATQFALEPGSTVKPMVGLGAMTDGLISE